jgi:hypothetical protein
LTITEVNPAAYLDIPYVESKMYKKSELKTIIDGFALLGFITNEEANALLNEIFSPQTVAYKVDGKTLTLTFTYTYNDEDGKSVTETRKETYTKQ